MTFASSGAGDGPQRGRPRRGGRRGPRWSRSVSTAAAGSPRGPRVAGEVNRRQQRRLAGGDVGVGGVGRQNPQHLPPRARRPHPSSSPGCAGRAARFGPAPAAGSGGSPPRRRACSSGGCRQSVGELDAVGLGHAGLHLVDQRLGVHVALLGCGADEPVGGAVAAGRLSRSSASSMVGVPPAISEMRNMIPTAMATIISGMTNKRTISLTDGGSMSESGVGAGHRAETRRRRAAAAPAGCFSTSEGMGSSVIALWGRGIVVTQPATVNPPRRGGVSSIRPWRAPGEVTVRQVAATDQEVQVATVAPLHGADGFDCQEVDPVVAVTEFAVGGLAGVPNASSISPRSQPAVCSSSSSSSSHGLRFVGFFGGKAASTGTSS